MLPYSDERRERLRVRVRQWVGSLSRAWGRDAPDGGGNAGGGRIAADARSAVRELAAAELLSVAVPVAAGLEPLSMVVVREELAGVSAFCDAMFAVQGLTAYPIAVSPGPARDRFLAALATGAAIGAFAATEPEAGSDLAAMTTAARRDDDHFVLDGQKTFISNAGVADVYVVFARIAGAGKEFGAFVVPADSPGLDTSPIEMLAAHVMGQVRLRGVRVPAAFRLDGEASGGDGLGLCLRALEVFRPTVGAAACGMARRALDEAHRRVSVRRQFGKPLLEQAPVRFALADMATALAGARALVYRAAWLQENPAAAEAEGDAVRVRAAASSMAKLNATEAAQTIIDQALQLHGAAGLVRGGVMERLYREVRALRIYEGASEIQKLVIARALFPARDGG